MYLSLCPHFNKQNALDLVDALEKSADYHADNFLQGTLLTSNRSTLRLDFYIVSVKNRMLPVHSFFREQYAVVYLLTICYATLDRKSRGY